MRDERLVDDNREDSFACSAAVGACSPAAAAGARLRSSTRERGSFFRRREAPTSSMMPPRTARVSPPPDRWRRRQSPPLATNLSRRGWRSRWARGGSTENITSSSITSPRRTCYMRVTRTRGIQRARDSWWRADRSRTVCVGVTSACGADRARRDEVRRATRGGTQKSHPTPTSRHAAESAALFYPRMYRPRVMGRETDANTTNHDMTSPDAERHVSPARAFPIRNLRVQVRRGWRSRVAIQLTARFERGRFPGVSRSPLTTARVAR